MTLQEIDILKQNGDEVSLSFTDSGVLKKRTITNQNNGKYIETSFLRKNKDRYVGIIGGTLEREDIANAIAISGVFRDDDGTLTEQEGLLGNIFYSVEKTKDGQE